MTVYVESGIAIEIHWMTSNPENMMVYLPDQQKTYFVSDDSYAHQLDIMNCPWIHEVCEAIKKFLSQ